MIEGGVTLPPLHPRCRCAIMYREVRDVKPNKVPQYYEAEFDLQRFGGQKILLKKFTTDIQAKEYFGTEWLKKLTVQEKSAIVQYTGKAYEKINSYLRGSLKDLTPSAISLLERQIAEIENALLKFELQDDLVLYRQCGYEFLNALQKSRFGFYHEPGFLSTTAVEGSVRRGNVRIEILLNAGKGVGAWIQPLSIHPNENEFLINRDAYFRIQDINRDESIVNVKLSYIGRNAGRIGKMKPSDIETQADFEAWLNEGEYNAEDKFTCKPGDGRFVETQEEFEAIVEMCIKNGLWGLTPEGIRKFLSAPITYSGFDEEGKTPQEVISELAQSERLFFDKE